MKGSFVTQLIGRLLNSRREERYIVIDALVPPPLPALARHSSQPGGERRKPGPVQAYFALLFIAFR